MNFLNRLTGTSASILMLLAQLPTFIATLKALHGRALTGDEKGAVSAFVVAALGSVEGLSGKAIAADPDVAAASTAVIDAIEAFHDLITRKHLVAPPAA